MLFRSPPAPSLRVTLRINLHLPCRVLEVHERISLLCVPRHPFGRSSRRLWRLISAAASAIVRPPDVRSSCRLRARRRIPPPSLCPTASSLSPANLDHFVSFFWCDVVVFHTNAVAYVLRDIERSSRATEERQQLEGSKNKYII